MNIANLEKPGEGVEVNTDYPSGMKECETQLEVFTDCGKSNLGIYERSFLEEVFPCIYRSPSFRLFVTAAGWERLYNCGRIREAEERDAISLNYLFRIINFFANLIFD